jgi:hypothetical protein
MNLLRIILFLYISHLLSSPNVQTPLFLCLSAAAGAGAGAALGYTPGGAVKLPGFQLCPGVPPRVVPGQAGAAAGAAPDHTPGGAVNLACFHSAPEH